MENWKFPVAGLLLLSLALPGPAAGQNPLPADGRQPAAAGPVAAGDSDAAVARDLQGKRKSAIAGLLMLGLLCGVFLVLLLVVIFWARRIRQAATADLPDQSPRDPVWYLRNRQDPTAGSSASDQSEAGSDGEVT